MKTINLYVQDMIAKQKMGISKLFLQTENNHTHIKLENYNSWIQNIKKSMQLCKYRQVIKEIETKRHDFDCFPEVHWKYQILEIESIFKIITKKFKRHQNEIGKENSHQYRSCQFWFNRIFILLQKLELESRNDLNKTISYNNESIMLLINFIFKSYIKFIYALIKFSIMNNQIIEVSAYLSILNEFYPYIDYFKDTITYIYFHKLQLLKAKILIENNNFIQARQALEDNINLCIKLLKKYQDSQFIIYYYNTLQNIEKPEDSYEINNKMNRRKSKVFHKNSIHINSSINDSNNKLKVNKGNEEETKSKNIVLRRLSIIKRKDSQKQIENNNNEKSSKNNLVNITKRKSIHKNIEKKEKEFFLTQITQDRTMNPDIKRIIEKILVSLSLNFYLKGVCLENLGDTSSALHAYNQLKWFSLMASSEENSNYTKYMFSLYKCGISNNEIILSIKQEKEKRALIKLIKSPDNEEKKKIFFKRNKLIENSKIKEKKNQKLKKFLEKTVNMLKNEEENNNLDYFKKMTKSNYILSTVKVIENLLSEDFRQILNKMKKLDIIRQNEETRNLINAGIIERNRRLLDYKENFQGKTIHKTGISFLSKSNYSSFKKIIKRNNVNRDNLSFNSEKSISDKRLSSLKDRNKKRFHHVIESKDKVTKEKDIFSRSTKNEHKSYGNFLDLKKFYITKFNLRGRNKVQRYEVDTMNFKQSMMRKKNFLENFYRKEINFQKDLLKTKSFDFKFNIPEKFDLKKSIKNAEFEFNKNYEMAKSNRGEKNLDNIFHENFFKSPDKDEKVGNLGIKNYNNDKVNGINSNSGTIINYKMINKEKLKELSQKYKNILIKRKSLLKKQNFIFGITFKC